MVADHVHDTEDKDWWVGAGRRRRRAFVETVALSIGLDVELGPDEEDSGQPDLYAGGVPSDLHCQTTPFFKAEERYGIPAQFAVTFNRDEYLRYLEGSGGVQLIWWVNWDVTHMTIGRRDYTVPKIAGVWIVPVDEVVETIRSGKAPLHVYRRRVLDMRGNAKESYILDLREFRRLTPQGWNGPSPSAFDQAS